MIRPLPHKLDQYGMTHRLIPVGIVFIFLFSAIMTLRSVSSRAAALDLSVQSGINGYCLDVHNNSDADNTLVESWVCNKSDAQKWQINPTTIKHGKDKCLSVYKNGTAIGENVILASCSEEPGQIWLRDSNGFYNPNSGLCLSMPTEATGHPLIIDSCNKLSEPFEQWHIHTVISCENLTKGEMVACNAVKEWTMWQSNTSSHSDLLNKYTDGASYEEWCADFVSYVYKESGYPFRHGETSRWDENIANKIQYQGFNYNQLESYTPQAGDVGYFNYGGGHVEIVISGGTKPTFIYGNSASIDPTTGNGQMKANTISSDGSEGSVQYYLSPRN